MWKIRNIARFIYRFTMGIVGPMVFVFSCFSIYPLKWTYPKLFYFIEEKLYRYLLSFLAFWMTSSGYIIWESGADISHLFHQPCLVMANHQSTADVPSMFYNLATKGNALEKVVWLIAKEFQWLPFGIASQVHGDAFIKQGRDVRSKEINHLKEHLHRIYAERDRKWMVVFPEGGFLYKRRVSSQKYAEKFGHPHLEFVTLPRVGAIEAALHFNAREGDTSTPVQYIVDITIAYAKQHTMDVGDVLSGCEPPCRIHFHFRVFPIAEVPKDNVQDLTEWLYTRWAEKEILLQTFYETGKFDPADSPGTNSLQQTAAPINLPVTFCIYIHIVYVGLFLYLCSLFLCLFLAFKHFILQN